MFENTPQPKGNSSNGGALVDVEGQRAIAETQAAMAIAKRFPRDQKEAFERIIVACQRPTLAEGAVYTYARGGKEISGPSIRLAEAIAQNWGNVQFGIRELEKREGESTVEAFAWDVETNTKQVKIFQVPHSRYSRQNGVTPLTDPRDIYEAVANQGARRLRACILGIIPGDVAEAAVQECDKTLQASVAITPENIKAMLEKFADFGVTKEMIETKIQRKLDSISPAQFLSMRKIYNSLCDGMGKATDYFEKPKNEDKELAEALKSEKTEKKEKRT